MPDTQGQHETPPLRADAGDNAAPPHAESLISRVSRRRWSIVAGACLLVAASLLLARRMDAAFVVATLGIVAWFWNERNRLLPHGIEEEEEIADEDEEVAEQDEK